MVWLIADGETPCRLAARVKLFSSATATKAANEVKSAGIIDESYSQGLGKNIVK